MSSLKSLIRSLIPKPLLNLYHFILVKLAAFLYHYPSRKMIVIGVTGTGGKSSTVYLLAKILESAGKKVGATSTFFFKIGDKEWLNDKKMTMLGRFQTQRLLSQMVKSNCGIALIETTSQGIEQYRHLGIDYDLVVLTNLYPEHLEAHGGFENYKKAKGKLFAALAKSQRKLFSPPKTIIVNGDDENALYFLSFPAKRKIVFGQENRFKQEESVLATEVIVSQQGLNFTIGETKFASSLLGQNNLYNLLCAITIAQSLGLSLEEIQKAVLTIKSIPGRLEFIEEGQPFKIIVDYAFEPKALIDLYEVAKTLPHQKIIHVLGSAGGGRDQWRRPKLGEIAGEKADYVIITNEDPYDEDPQLIIDQVAQGAKEGGKEGDSLFKILDRREAIRKALSLAQKNDLVLITGKGAEQAICVKNGKKLAWDDRKVVREELLIS